MSWAELNFCTRHDKSRNCYPAQRLNTMLVLTIYMCIPLGILLSMGVWPFRVKYLQRWRRQMFIFSSPFPPPGPLLWLFAAIPQPRCTRPSDRHLQHLVQPRRVRRSPFIMDI